MQAIDVFAILVGFREQLEYPLWVIRVVLTEHHRLPPTATAISAGMLLSFQ
jgi:hypothetical protein